MWKNHFREPIKSGQYVKILDARYPDAIGIFEESVDGEAFVITVQYGTVKVAEGDIIRYEGE